MRSCTSATKSLGSVMSIVQDFTWQHRLSECGRCASAGDVDFGD